MVDLYEPAASNREDKTEEYRRVYTQFAKDAFPDMQYEGSHVIHSNSRIQGGVLYYPGVHMEACVVDFGKDPFLQQLYVESLRKNRSRNGGFNLRTFKEHILGDVFDVVKSNIPYDYDELKNGVSKDLIGQKIILGVYVERRGGKGVCRHQALAATAILERLADQGFLRGSVRFRSNLKIGEGGHAWAQYTTSSGEIGILDVAQGFYGYIDDAETWNYKV